MKKLFFLSLLVTGVMYGCNNNSNQHANNDSTHADTGTVKVDDDVTEFITEVLNSGAMEVELGKLAQTQASSPRVKAFGDMMIKDHTLAGDELKVIAAQKNIVTAQVMEGAHLKDMEDLKKESGVNFDKKYIKMMLSAHRKDINKFEDMAKDDDDPALKAFAAKTLPKLKMHLDSAKAINKEVKATLDPNDISDAMERNPHH
jgi:putative membrane protein